MKIDDDELYNKAKEGEIKGFSIEGYFADKYDLQKDDKNQEIIKQLKDLLK
jgi:adenylylsulfate kinase-like enzyme